MREPKFKSDPMASSPYTVRATHCDYRATDEEVYLALKRATDPLTRAWDRLRRARRIGIKFNQDWPVDRVVHHLGHRQQLVSDPVAAAVLRLLRENTTADLFYVDIGVHRNTPLEARTPLMPLLRRFGVECVDGNVDSVVWREVPGGGLMFRRYPVLRSAAEADAMVSVQKMKNHGFMGVTLCLKNLFGLMPMDPGGRPRGYYHHLVRMPHMLADLGRMYDPALNILDAIVCQAGEEWGPGDAPRVTNALVAGDHVVATDACAAHLMGHDPQSDWLTPPFHRDRNSLRVAAEGGFGTVDLREIDFASEVTAPLAEFHANITDPTEMVRSWRKTTAEQGLFYRDHRDELVASHAGKYVLVQMGEVKWESDTGNIWASRRVLAGDHPEQAMYFKYVEAEEQEGERYEVYEKTLASFA
jgi:uncharacterized protein (DUF362 family)